MANKKPVNKSSVSQKKPIASTASLSPEKSILRVPSGWALIKDTFSFARRHWKPISVISLIYLICYWIFIDSQSTLGIDDINAIIENEQLSGIVGSITFGVIAISNAQNSQSSSLMSAFLFVIFSLAYIWAIRRLANQNSFKIREAFYSGMQPLIPFILVMLLAVIQLLPFLIGASLYSYVSIGGLATSWLEHVLFIVIWIALSTLSAYWLSVTLLSLYAVTLPNMYPMRSLQAVKKLIQGYRWQVFRRVAVLCLFLAVLWATTFVLSLLLVKSAILLVVTLLTIILLPLAHIYLFLLYKQLVDSRE
jgi:hypothetical protein